MKRIKKSHIQSSLFMRKERKREETIREKKIEGIQITVLLYTTNRDASLTSILQEFDFKTPQLTYIQA
jgi:hypothetical protein